MDAKPQRPARSRTFRDENLPPTLTQPQAKTVHSRNKSSPALSTLAATHGFKGGLRRTAFADVSNTSKALNVIQDDSVLSHKSSLAPLKENAATFQKPAQRPLSVSGIKGLFNIGSGAISKQPTVEEKEERPVPDAVPVPAPAQKIVTRKPTMVFKEQDQGPEAPPSESEAQQSIVHHLLRKKSSIYVDSNEVLPVSEPLPFIPAVKDDAPPGSSSSNYYDLESEGVPIYAGVDYPSIAEEPEYLPVADAYHDVIAQPPIRPTAIRPAATLPTNNNALEEQLIDPALQPAMVRDGRNDRWVDEAYAEYEEDYTTARSLKSRGETTTGPTTIVIAPKVTSEVEHELAAARRFVEESPNAAELEEDEQWDTSMVAEYSEEIFSYMRNLEERMRPNPYYMDSQTEVQWSMRSVLMDWLVQVHHRFSLLPETLFLTVNYVDRFLSSKVVSLAKLQLVGATAIFVAAKYEEINCPSVQEIAYMVDGGYSIDEILKAERFMLSMLQFELGWPGPMSFLRRISKADDYDLETRTLAKYFLEITIMDERFVGCIPSYVAAGSHCLARLMLKKGSWSQKHVHYSGYTYSQLYPLLVAVLSCCEDASKHHSAVYDKYGDKRFKRSSHFVQNEVASRFILPSMPQVGLLAYGEAGVKW